MQYPIKCRSLYCGETDRTSSHCRACSNRPELEAYWNHQEALAYAKAQADAIEDGWEWPWQT